MNEPIIFKDYRIYFEKREGCFEATYYRKSEEVKGKVTYYLADNSGKRDYLFKAEWRRDGELKPVPSVKVSAGDPSHSNWYDRAPKNRSIRELKGMPIGARRDLIGYAWRVAEHVRAEANKP